MSDEVPECLGEELIGRGEALFTVPEEHAGPAGQCGPAGLGNQCCLAQAGFAGDKHQLASLTRRHPLYRVRHQRHLDLPSNHPDPRVNAEATRERDDTGAWFSERLPEHLDGLDRVG